MHLFRTAIKYFPNLGFDNFITIERHESKKLDGGRLGERCGAYRLHLDTMEETAEKDMIYTISVQGHGDYPTSSQEGSGDSGDRRGIQRILSESGDILRQSDHEMDAFLEDLIGKLENCGEDTMVIAYGDHLPGLDFETDDLKEGNKYETPYFIWDNFGYNSSHRKEESEN